jgi:hypothetical protein
MSLIVESPSKHVILSDIHSGVGVDIGKGSSGGVTIMSGDASRGTFGKDLMTGHHHVGESLSESALNMRGYLADFLKKHIDWKRGDCWVAERDYLDVIVQVTPSLKSVAISKGEYLIYDGSGFRVLNPNAPSKGIDYINTTIMIDDNTEVEEFNKALGSL